MNIISSLIKLRIEYKLFLKHLLVQNRSFHLNYLRIENQWIILIAQGDKVAFQKLYNAFSTKVYNTALSYVQQTQDAEEIAQDVFVSIFQKAGMFKGNSSLSTWIYRITVNTSLNHLKKKKRHAVFDSELPAIDPPDFDHPGVLFENKEKARLLFKTIATLNEKQKSAFILSFIEDLPRQEVANIMEISLKAVESLLQRAKQNLRKKLANHYPNRRKTTECLSKKKSE